MKKIIAAVLGGTAVASLAFASASLLTVDGGVIQAGVSTDLTCDDTGVKVNWSLETGTNSVSGVRIEGIDAACAGAEMFVRTNVMDDSTKVTLDGSGQARVGFAPTSPESLESIKIWIEG
ncbi:hypothetical protein [Ornithinimicrobium avium]|uniref:hypothetical protein n=1 Tax=Ornithinimicrobium avium TaxID=2283195 RepID=UPI0013B3DE49|nr:hypothetical protein [Ornithinimicrobium avium]